MTSPFILNQQISIRIDRLAYGGAGVGRFNNFVVFVDFAAPGDLVKVEVTEIKQSFARARLVQVIEPGPSRRQPPCPVFGVCGGCQWQHVSYQEQLIQKQNAVQFAFKKFQLPEHVFSPIHPSPEEWRYRNRVQLHVSNGSIGFFARQSHEVVAITDCPITETVLTNHFPKIQEEATRNPYLNKVELHLTETLSVATSTQGGHGEELGFSQVNRSQNVEMIRLLLEMVRDSSPTQILDLYAGHGNLTWPLMEEFPDIPLDAVELNVNAVRAAKEKLALHQDLAQVRFHAQDVELFLRTYVGSKDLLVVADPPRAGSSVGVLKSLARLQPKTLVYIGCDLNHLVRDLSEFFSANQKLQLGTYEITKVQPVDMFPQTFHIETLVLLRRK